MGIKCFAVSRNAGLLAIVEKGLNPKINIYRIRDFHLTASLSRNAPELGYTAMAFSRDGSILVTCADEPELIISLREWAKVRRWHQR